MYSSIAPKSCKICMSKYQELIADVANEETPLLFRRRDRQRRFNERYGVFIMGILIFILFLGMTIGFRLIVVENREIQPSDVIIFSSRQNWRAATVEKNEDLEPISHKLLLVYTNSPSCYNQQNCTKVIRNLQEESIKRNNSDLPYNFIIADDDKIYEGRGWDYAPDISPYTDNATLAIAILGYAGDFYPTASQKDQLIILINLSISHHKLGHCFHMSVRPEEKAHLQDLTDRIRSTFIKTACI